VIELPFDPLERAEKVESLVMEDLSRRYYRFRPARYYGGIATADLVGCCFLCAYCWNFARNLHPEQSRARCYSPREVGQRLLDIARQRGYSKVRLSGAEPLLGHRSFEHVLHVLGHVTAAEPRMEFILETNGFLLGHSPELADRLARFRKLAVRVSLKGWDEASFQKISGAEGSFFELPLRGLKTMLDRGIQAWPAVMYETFGASGIEEIHRRMEQLGMRPEELELEYLEVYPFVLENLKKRSVCLKASPLAI
jgi:uncharacterized Fe-S cluster-containing radical SAM superfamily protein